MTRRKPQPGISILLDNTQLDWIEKMVTTGEFENRSAALRKCVTIAHRVYKYGDPKEKERFIIGHIDNQDEISRRTRKIL